MADLKDAIRIAGILFSLVVSTAFGSSPDPLSFPEIIKRPQPREPSQWEMEFFRFPDDRAHNISDASPARTSWRLLEAAFNANKDEFAEQLFGFNQKEVQESFEEWQERLHRYQAMPIILQSRTSNENSFVSLRGFYFNEIIQLKKVDNDLWKVFPLAIDDSELQKLKHLFAISRTSRREIEKRIAESNRRYAEEFRENFGEEEYERMIKAKKLEQEMKEAGKRIPNQNNFHEMIEILDFEFFDPPRIFDARHDPGPIDNSQWQQVARKLLHVRWRDQRLTPRLSPFDDVEPEAKSIVQVLFTINREVDDIRFVLVYFFAFDGDTGFTDQWVTPSKLVLAQDEHGNWNEKPRWEREHTVFGHLTGIVRHRIRFSSGNLQTMPGESIEKALEESDLPAPLDRIYDVSECVEF